MKLSKILPQLKSSFEIVGSHDSLDHIVVKDIAIDSRLVEENSVFFALTGKTKDGSEFIDSALKKGASLIVAKNSNHDFYIKCDNPFLLLVEFLQILYHPLPHNIYAITGTNGKTSTAEFTRQILEFLGKKSASIGTLGVMCDEEIKQHLQNSSLTTPDIVSLYKNLKILKENGVNDVAIEVSSIGLEQGRVAGIKIAVGAFTNFTQDHLDYHKSMDEYFRCKMILFNKLLENSGCAVLNTDISQFDEIKKICQNREIKIIEYGFRANDLKLIKVAKHEVVFEYKDCEYKFNLVADGEFQAFNALCALGNILAKHKVSHVELENLLQKFSALNPAPGRMQKVGTLQNKAEIFIDFAHSPDALMNVLKLARALTKSRVIVLFGCGGDRDAKKRPIMGKIAADLADFIVITDDNPRTESPEEIRKQILVSCPKSKTIEIDDRKLAIEKAITMLQPHDILILAGKGHEKYQIIGDKKTEFDEEKIVKNVLTKFFKS